MLAGMLVASTMHISTGLSLQVARVCKWVSRQATKPASTLGTLLLLLGSLFGESLL